MAADTSKLSYTTTEGGNIVTSNLGPINPSTTNETIKTIAEKFQDLTAAGDVTYATRVDTTKIQCHTTPAGD